MSQQKMHVDVVSPEGSIFSGVANEVVVKGEMGELGIYPGHAQLLTRVHPGPVRIISKHGEQLLFVSGGVLEIQPNSVNILADSIERAEDLDEAAALKAKESAERDLKAGDTRRSREELMQAIAKLRVVELVRAKKRRA